MQRRLGRDFGLSFRMVLTIFLLAFLYLVFGAFLFRWIGWPTIIILGLLALAQYYWSDKLILLSLGAVEVDEQQAPQLHDMVGRLAAMTGTPKPMAVSIETQGP